MPKKILIVDDDPDLRNIVGVLLNSVGYETSMATDGVEALEALSRETPDLLILDLSMPRLNGWEVAQKVRKDKKMGTLPIVAFTANALKGEEKKALDAGCNAYIAKPFSLDALLDLVQKLLPKA